LDEIHKRERLQSALLILRCRERLSRWSTPDTAQGLGNAIADFQAGPDAGTKALCNRPLHDFLDPVAEAGHRLPVS